MSIANARVGHSLAHLRKAPALTAKPKSSFFERKEMIELYSMKEGIDEVLDTIPVIRDEASGLSLSRDEVKDILLDLSNASAAETEGRLSEDVSEDEDNFDDLNDEVERVTGDWSSDKIEDLKLDNLPRMPMIGPLTPLTPPKPATRTSTALTVTPPRPNQSASSSFSDFDSSLFERTNALRSTQSTPPIKRQDPKVSRNLFGSTERQVLLAPPPKMSPKESPIQPKPSPPQSPVLKQAPDFSSVYPDGYTIVPVRNSKNRKSDAKKPKDSKKRGVSSPNYPSSKASRLDQTEAAINQLQMGQANQNEMLSRLTNQLGTLAFNLGLHFDKKTNG